jgi:hypothetical protein
LRQLGGRVREDAAVGLGGHSASSLVRIADMA